MGGSISSKSELCTSAWNVKLVLDYIISNIRSTTDKYTVELV